MIITLGLLLSLNVVKWHCLNGLNIYGGNAVM